MCKALFCLCGGIGHSIAPCVCFDAASERRAGVRRFGVLFGLIFCSAQTGPSCTALFFSGSELLREEFHIGSR